MIVKLLYEHHLEFLSLTGGCTGSSESTLIKMLIVGNHMYWLNYINVHHKMQHMGAQWVSGRVLDS